MLALIHTDMTDTTTNWLRVIPDEILLEIIERVPDVRDLCSLFITEKTSVSHMKSGLIPRLNVLCDAGIQFCNYLAYTQDKLAQYWKKHAKSSTLFIELNGMLDFGRFFLLEVISGDTFPVIEKPLIILFRRRISAAEFKIEVRMFDRFWRRPDETDLLTNRFKTDQWVMMDTFKDNYLDQTNDECYARLGAPDMTIVKHMISSRDNGDLNF